MTADTRPTTGERGPIGFTDPGVGPLVPAAVTALTLTVAFGLLALGVEHFWMAFVVGFGGVLPLSIGVAARRRTGSDRSDDGGTRNGTGPLAELRLRYARGELSDAEFERRVERLLERAPEGERPAAGPVEHLPDGHTGTSQRTPSERDA